AAEREFLDEWRNAGEVKHRQELQMRSEAARENEADEHGQKNAERECEGRKNWRGKTHFANEVAQTSATHQPDRLNAKGNDKDLAEPLKEKERNFAMRPPIDREKERESRAKVVAISTTTVIRARSQRRCAVEVSF